MENLLFNQQFFVAFSVTILTILFSYYTFTIYKLRRKYEHIPGPPTKGILGFYFGHLFEFFKLTKEYKVNNELVIEWYTIIIFF